MEAVGDRAGRQGRRANYVASLGTWSADQTHDPARFARREGVWEERFRHDIDPTGLRAERNRFGYRPYARGVVVRTAAALDASVIESCRVAAGLAATPIMVTSAKAGAGVDVVEGDDEFRARLADVTADKVRVLGYPSGTFCLDVMDSGLAHDDIAFVADPRVELHRWVREQALSETRHRHGNLLDA
jgi:RHH-type proline utilization regulon transcriptional repressor/proline dehydrogenase/delta 1-pyrroline-5-carboxylate dehydrogenase